MDKKMIRFIDSRYNELFSVPDGGNVVLTYFDAETAIRSCQYIDEYHTKIGSRVFHICEFAELQERNGTMYVPENVKKGDICDSYEIYQIKDVQKTDYCFRSFAEAGKNLNRADYVRVYAGMLAPNMTLDHLYAKHNMDNRPFGDRMRSMSMSDVIVLKREGKASAFYVDTVEFTEVSKFFDQELSHKNKPKREKDHER